MRIAEPDLAEAIVEQLVRLTPQERALVEAELAPEERDRLAVALQYSHELWIQPHQHTPAGLWRWWVFLAGRNAGKTWRGATWIIEQAKSGEHRWLTIVAPTREALRKICLFGPAGIMTLSPPWFRPTYEPSKLLLTWPNGVVARCYSAEKPERLRGEQHERVWCDEVAAWPRPESFDHVDFGLRLGANPQGVVTTTPKSTPLMMDMVLGPKIGDKRIPREDVVVTKARSEDNALIARKVVAALRAKYGASRFGRQEMDAELLEKTGSELFQDSLLERDRVKTVPKLVLVAVAVDPTRSDSPTDETGIIVGARGEDGHAYIFGDHTVRASPHGWATAAIAAYNRYSAHVLVYEKNRLGKRTEDTLRVLGPSVKWEAVQAADGKVARAEPVSALCEQGKVHLVGKFPMLETELTTWSPGQPSPNRMDAFVWLVYKLMLEDQRPELVVVS